MSRKVGQATILRYGFFWASLTMVGISGLGTLRALIRPPSGVRGRDEEIVLAQLT